MNKKQMQRYMNDEHITVYKAVEKSLNGRYYTWGPYIPDTVYTANGIDRELGISCGKGVNFAAPHLGTKELTQDAWLRYQLSAIREFGIIIMELRVKKSSIITPQFWSPDGNEVEDTSHLMNKARAYRVMVKDVKYLFYDEYKFIDKQQYVDEVNDVLSSHDSTIRYTLVEGPKIWDSKYVKLYEFVRETSSRSMT